MKNKIFLFVLTLIFLAGCKDSFFDINENPNAPTEEAVEPRVLLPMVLNATAKKMAISYDFAAHWMGYWARGGNFGPSVPLEDYNVTTTYEQNNWVNGNTTVVNPVISWYDIIKDANVMEKKGKALNQPFYVAAAKVVKSIGYMYLVDMYNNVPYSEALNIDAHIAPAYDNGQDIYKDLLLQLDSARTIFASQLEITPALRAADIMFEGDTEMWVKLANTQKLKLLIHQSEVLGSAPTAQISDMAANGGFLAADETAEVNPGYALNEYQLNPFYGTYLRDHNNTLIDAFNRANKYVLSKYMSNGDIRYRYFFSKAQTPNPAEYLGSEVGAPQVAGLTSVNQSNVAGPGLAKSGIQPQWLFTSVESLFLQAEAAQRGWLSGGGTESLYREAVTESFRWLGVADAETTAAAYLDGQAIANWNAATNKIQLIVMQKYLALCGINNFEAWVDYRRLGIPSDVPLSLNAARDGRHIPLRLLYPQNEYNFNSANVLAQGTIDAQTSRIFWDKD